MKWYYVDNGQQAGPVEETEFAQLTQLGKLRPDTLVWHEGMSNWQPFSAVCPPEFAAAVAAPPAAPMPSATTGAGEASCAECGRVFKVDDMIRHGPRYVCASCKPVFMQKLREGVAGTGAPRAAGTATLEEVLARDYEHDVGGYFSRAWQCFKNDAGSILGATVLVYLCVMAAGIVPYLGIVLSVVFTGPLKGGLWLFYLKKLRGVETRVGDAFGGFGPRFGQLLLGSFVPGLLAGLCMIPMVIVFVVGLVMFGFSPGSGPPSAGGFGLGLMSLGGLLGVAGFCGLLYLTTCWIFALPLVADKGLDFWTAMSASRRVVCKHWWLTFLVLFLGVLLVFAGVLACFFGLLVAGPVVLAAWAGAYEKLFGDLAPSQP